MFEILVNGNPIAIVAGDFAKVFVNALVAALPVEVSITTRKYEPTPVPTEAAE